MINERWSQRLPTSRGAHLGSLTNGAEMQNSTRQVNTMVLDKIGTVTTRQPAIRRSPHRSVRQRGHN